MKSALFLCLLCIANTFAAPTPLENTIVETLVAKGIIVDQSKNPAGYRLSHTITRAEAAGVALRVADIPLEDTYFCKNYFRDVKYDRLNNWVCRAIEIAADYNIISRVNDQAKPKSPVTRIEALAMIVRAGKIPYPKNVDRTQYPKNMPQWQIDLLEGALQYHIISSVEYFGPDAPATRMDVFGMIYNMQFAGTKLDFKTDKNIPKMSLNSAPEENQNGITVTLPGKITNTTPAPTPSAPLATLKDFIITVPDVVEVNMPFDLQVTAVDSARKPIENYRGTIYFESTDVSLDTLFPDALDTYTFTADDK